MWIWIIIIAVILGAIIGFAQSGEKEDAVGGAMAGGCLAVSCLGRHVKKWKASMYRTKRRKQEIFPCRNVAMSRCRNGIKVAHCVVRK